MTIRTRPHRLSRCRSRDACTQGTGRIRYNGRDLADHPSRSGARKLPAYRSRTMRGSADPPSRHRVTRTEPRPNTPTSRTCGSQPAAGRSKSSGIERYGSRRRGRRAVRTAARAVRSSRAAIPARGPYHVLSRAAGRGCVHAARRFMILSLPDGGSGSAKLLRIIRMYRAMRSCRSRRGSRGPW